jgi:peroxiredoxin-like protein
MQEKHSYNVDLEWKSGRFGVLSSNELDDSIEVATPPEFPKGIEGVWSPEHLFVSSVSSCLMTTFLAIAEFSKLEYISLNVDATGVLEKVDGKFMMSSIELRPHLIIPEGVNTDKAERILIKAEKACLISNSIKSEITMEPTVEIQKEHLLVR